MKGQKIVECVVVWGFFCFVFLTQLLKVQRLDCLHCPTPNSCEAAYAPLLLHKFISLCFWLACASSPSASLASLRLWPCTSKSSFCLPLRAAYICLLSVETKETDHKAYYRARNGAHCVCVRVCALPLSSSLSSCDAGHMVSRQAAQ